MRFLVSAVLFAASMAMTQNQALAEVVELTPVADNTLFEDPQGDFSSGAGEYLFFGKVGPDGDELLRRALVRFDVSAIPANAIINSVTMHVTINKVPSSGALSDSATLHRVTEPWGEAGSAHPFGAGGQGAPSEMGDATWIHGFYDTTPWSTPGGAFEPEILSSAPFSTLGVEEITFASTDALMAEIKSWLVNPSSNYGWIILGDEGTSKNARRIASRECVDEPSCFEDPPTLVIDYTVPSVTDYLSLSELTTNLDNPISAAHAGDGSGRLFVVEQGGEIRIFDTNTDSLIGTPFLDIQTEVFSLLDGGGGNEQGLLGLAFHPDYANNGRFFVNYTNSDWHTVVAEYQVSEGNPNVADNSGTILMEFDQEARNHNGGDMHFGPDGMLYIASGDGGGSNDQYDNAQDVDTLRGALLRIDVDSPYDASAEHCGIVANYGIPEGNAFPGASDGCDAILHIGLRNPWRFSFDAANDELIIADVGQGAWEEVNRVPGNSSGLNFGWPCREGRNDFNVNKICIGALTEPVYEYSHAGGNCSITGGYVYRGSRLPIEGLYIFGDWCTERIWLAERSGDNWSAEEWEGVAATLTSIASFAQDESCELYVIDRGEGAPGALYRITDSEQLLRSGFESYSCQ